MTVDLFIYLRWDVSRVYLFDGSVLKTFDDDSGVWSLYSVILFPGQAVEEDWVISFFVPQKDKV